MLALRYEKYRSIVGKKQGLELFLDLATFAPTEMGG
jgi:hypothetical protein